MLKTDDIAQFVAIIGLMNYCKSHDDCKNCNMYNLCNVLTGEKKLTFVIDKIMFEYSDNEEEQQYENKT